LAALLAIGGSLLLHNTFKANAKIMPPQQNQSMTATAMLSQMGPLAALAGNQLGLRTPSDIYVAMLHSRTVGDGMIDHFSLMQIYKLEKRPREDARKRLDGATEIVAGKDGVISISVEDRDPQLAADLANGYIDELEKLTKTLALSEASKRRMFFERETKVASEDLANAELALKQTQEKTHLILLDPQSKAMIDAVSQLRLRISAQEVVIQSMRSFATPENPDLIRAQQELTALQGQLAHLEHGHGKASIDDLPIESVPTAGLEYVRRLREVRYREALFELLAKQFEAAKIDEARDALIVQPLDKAVRPERKYKPARSIIVISITFIAVLAAILIAFLMEAMERAKDDPQFVARWQLFRFYLRGREKSAG
jgi:uncharacterized protein involved in exopolysaccharide biosynthesis